MHSVQHHQEINILYVVFSDSVSALWFMKNIVWLSVFCRSWSCIPVRCHGHRAWRCLPTSHIFSLPSTLPWTFSSTHSRFVCLTSSLLSTLPYSSTHSWYVHYILHILIVITLPWKYSSTHSRYVHYISHILITLNSSMNILIYAFKVCLPTYHTSSLPSTLPWTSSSAH
jgi:hypothetical protein